MLQSLIKGTYLTHQYCKLYIYFFYLFNPHADVWDLSTIFFFGRIKAAYRVTILVIKFVTWTVGHVGS